MENPTIANFLVEVTRIEDLLEAPDQNVVAFREPLEAATGDARDIAANPNAHNVGEGDFQTWTEGLDERLRNVDESKPSAKSLEDLRGYLAEEIQPKAAPSQPRE